MAQSGQFGAFGPTTQVWDVGELQNINVNSPEFKELLVRMYQNLNLMTLVLNAADKGIYDTQEFLNGQQWFPDPTTNSTTAISSHYRTPLRKVINMGALKNTGTTSQLHGITVSDTLRWTRIYGVATAPGTSHPALNGIPLPYVSTTAGSIVELNVTSTTVNAITNDDKSAFTYCYVVLEYLLY
jgi:hypothetical protein